MFFDHSYTHTTFETAVFVKPLRLSTMEFHETKELGSGVYLFHLHTHPHTHTNLHVPT